MKKALFVLALAAFALAGQCASGTEYSYSDLANRLIDLEYLATKPADGEVCGQWSSYDRASIYNEETGKYAAWDANGDGTGYIRKEGDKEVMAEIEGPGCIWRIWSAQPLKGKVAIYIDGNSAPVIDMPFEDYFNLKREPFIYSGQVYVASQGCNSFVPIPFQKSCKIVAEPNWGRYFQIQYTKLPKDAIVPSFTGRLSNDDRRALIKVDRTLRLKIGSDPAGAKQNAEHLSMSAIIEPGMKETVLDLKGEHAITGFWVMPRKPMTMESLRNTTISIYWDGEEKPSVWSPIGDFFGTGPRENLYKSLPMGMTERGYYCYWYMPFAKSAKVVISNESESAFDAMLLFDIAPLARPADSLLRFHAKWHRDTTAYPESERWIDWPMLQTKGQGRFVGTALEVWNPAGGWWGEGDEKFYVDGEKFPSIFGTGSEDYFGYAWCNPTPFERPFHNQTLCENANRGHISVNRWQIAENVPFQKSFDGIIEKYFLNSRPTFYANTVYWYLSADGEDNYGPVRKEDRFFYPMIDIKVKGAIEAESLKVREKTGGQIALQDLGIFGNYWSNASHLWWREAKPGDKLTLELPVEKPGRYQFKYLLTKAPDYAIVQLYWDGKPVGKPIDCYAKDVITTTGEIALFNADMEAGIHTVTIEIVGKNDKAVPQYMVGIDYFRLKPLK